jgi:hypothetical protein
MAEIFVSPGVYVRERDFSFYVSSIGDSALALVGETKKGPAMRPTLLTNMGDFREIFGDLDPNKHIGYCAKSYFKYSNQLYVVRVLGADALRSTSTSITINSTGGTVLANLMVSGTPAMYLIGDTGADSGTTAADGTFKMVLSGGTDLVYSGNVNLVNANSPVYIETLFPRNTTIEAGSAALTHVFGNAAGGDLVSSGTTSGYTATAGDPMFDVNGYSNARTPVIVGDTADAISAGVALFTIYTISDGTTANQDVKITVENIDVANNTFDIAVRQWSDTNQAQILLEKYPKLSMDPANLSYIARQIGDSRDETGDYTLISKYIYVEVAANAPKTALPYGFNSIVTPFGPGKTVPEWPITSIFVPTTSVKRQYLGVNFEAADPDQFMGGWNSAWSMSSTGGTTIKGFHMNSTSNPALYSVGPSGTTDYDKAHGKFLIPLLGGNDGWANDEETRDLLDGNPIDATVKTQFDTAFATIASTEDIDINLLAVPGVWIGSSVGIAAKELVEERADAFYIGDMPSSVASAENAATITATIDSNYAATYWPFVKIFDADNNQDVTIPPTAQALEAIAYTDQISYPWFAPAGLNRGLLTDVIRAQYKLTQDDRETLYENKINPIATFAGQGIAVWGQKTLQTRQTALDRINVRRMMLYVEKIIAGAALYLDFEQNDETTWDRFKAMVQPILDVVKINRGITDFRVIMDETTNTPDLIERGQMVGNIYIKPTKTAEVILINFNLTAQGATFEE